MPGYAAAIGEVILVERRTQLLGGLPRDVDLVESLIGGDRWGQASLLSLGEAFPAAAQDRADPVYGVTGVSVVTDGLLLDPPADLVDRLPAELDAVNGAPHSPTSMRWP